MVALLWRVFTVGEDKYECFVEEVESADDGREEGPEKDEEEESAA